MEAVESSILEAQKPDINNLMKRLVYLLLKNIHFQVYGVEMQ